MTIAERMVEAAARASVAFAYNDTLATDDASFAQWREEYGDAWEQERRCARASLTAALALAEAEAGAVLCVVAERDDWKRLCTIAEPEVAAMRLEIQRLRAIVRVNGIRHGATHAEIDAVLAGDAPELTGSLAPKTQPTDAS